MSKEMDEDLTDDETGELTREFFRSPYSWKGVPLKPYTAGTDWLFSQILDHADAPFTIFMEFIFLHTLDDQKAVELCWDKSRFRLAMLAWLNELGPVSNEDKISAMELFEEIRGWARKSSVEVVSDDQKKTEEIDLLPSPV
jgi:hypothetical protein